MGEPVRQLLDEYRERFARGGEPDVRAYLERAGGGAAELRSLLDDFLLNARMPEPAPESVAAMRALLVGTPPLLELRRRKGVPRSAMVDAIVGRLGIDAAKRERVARYYHLLESGLLALGRIDERVFEAVAEALGVTRAEIVAWRAPQVAAPALMRAAPAPAEPVQERAATALRLDLSGALDRTGDLDEVDRLFGVVP
jgi:hypothetical protein